MFLHNGNTAAIKSTSEKHSYLKTKATEVLIYAS